MPSLGKMLTRTKYAYNGWLYERLRENIMSFVVDFPPKYLEHANLFPFKTFGTVKWEQFFSLMFLPLPGFLSLVNCRARRHGPFWILMFLELGHSKHDALSWIHWGYNSMLAAFPWFSIDCLTAGEVWLSDPSSRKLHLRVRRRGRLAFFLFVTCCDAQIPS